MSFELLQTDGHTHTHRAALPVAIRKKRKQAREVAVVRHVRCDAIDVGELLQPQRIRGRQGSVGVLERVDSRRITREEAREGLQRRFVRRVQVIDGDDEERKRSDRPSGGGVRRERQRGNGKQRR